MELTTSNTPKPHIPEEQNSATGGHGVASFSIGRSKMPLSGDLWVFMRGHWLEKSHSHDSHGTCLKKTFGHRSMKWGRKGSPHPPVESRPRWFPGQQDHIPRPCNNAKTTLKSRSFHKRAHLLQNMKILHDVSAIHINFSGCTMVMCNPTTGAPSLSGPAARALGRPAGQLIRHQRVVQCFGSHPAAQQSQYERI